MLGSFDIAPFVIAGSFLFAVVVIAAWILWEAYHPETDPLEEWFGVPEFEDTPFVIEQLTSLDRRAA